MVIFDREEYLLTRPVLCNGGIFELSPHPKVDALVCSFELLLLLINGVRIGRRNDTL